MTRPQRISGPLLSKRLFGPGGCGVPRLLRKKRIRYLFCFLVAGQCGAQAGLFGCSRSRRQLASKGQGFNCAVGCSDHGGNRVAENLDFGAFEGAYLYVCRHESFIFVIPSGLPPQRGLRCGHELRIPSGAESPTLPAYVTARLKPCPFKQQTANRRCSSCHEYFGFCCAARDTSRCESRSWLAFCLASG